MSIQLKQFKDLVNNIVFNGVIIPKRIDYNNLIYTTIPKSNISKYTEKSPKSHSSYFINLQNIPIVKDLEDTLDTSHIKLSCLILDNLSWDLFKKIADSYNEIHKDLIFKFLELYLSIKSLQPDKSLIKKLQPFILHGKFNPFPNYLVFFKQTSLFNLQEGFFSKCGLLYEEKNEGGRIIEIIKNEKIKEVIRHGLIVFLTEKPTIVRETINNATEAAKFIAFNIHISRLYSDILNK